MGKLAIGCLALLAAMAAAPAPAFSWGFKGHQIVGEIAQQILDRDDPQLAQRLREMLKGRELGKVATYPDCALFDCGQEPKGFFNAYNTRNRDNAKYHFTDVPLPRGRYFAGSAGTHPHDVVQILRYAVGRLRGQPPADVPADLLPHEAVWIIAHMVGDIHQPLHVGALYFDNTCSRIVSAEDFADDADFVVGATVAETHGGGWIKLAHNRQLHKLWDNDAVDGAMRLAGIHDGSLKNFAAAAIADPPADWKTPGDVGSWSRRWANEILPLAKEAHDPSRITIKTPGVDQDNTHKVECFWQAELKPGYDDWAAQRVRQQLAKAGFRLAAMLREVLEEN